MFLRSLKCATCLGAWQALVVEGRRGSLSALAALRRMNAKSSRREPLSHFAAPVQIGGLVDIHTTCSGQPKNLFTHNVQSYIICTQPFGNHTNSTQCTKCKSLMIPAYTHRNWSHGYEIAKARSRREIHSTTILSSNMTIGQKKSTTRYLNIPIPFFYQFQGSFCTKSFYKLRIFSRIEIDTNTYIQGGFNCSSQFSVPK